MAQNFGLGRGLSSLIPNKKTGYHSASPNQGDQAGNKISEPQKDFNYFGGKPASSGSNQLPAQSNSPGINNPFLANHSEKDNTVVEEIKISDISSNPFQPRLDFSEEKLYELAESIKEHGIIQPIVVSKNGEKYEVIAGERRCQAAKIAGLEKIPAIIRKADNQQKLELAVVENIQRESLSPIEEAKSYKKMTEEFKLTQEEVAKKLSKSRSAVANKIRLLDLPVEIQKALVEGRITEGHAKLLLAIPNPEKQKAFFEMIIKNNLTVRQTEDKTREVSVRTHKRNIAIDPEIKSIEDELAQMLGTKVRIKKSGGGGQIVIEYYSKEELDNILSRIK
jgi:ParB family transcriptional regulator, chromosome partitioning protein